MNRFELNYDWDNAEQAYWNKTEHHIAHGKLLVWQLPNETNDVFTKRANETASRQLCYINSWGKSLCPAIVTKSQFTNIIEEDKV